MRTSLSDLLATGRVLLADGATGTNYMVAGLGPGEPPEFWTYDRPDDVMRLHQQFVDAGADIILTNTFGCNPHRLKLHNAQARTYELAKGAAQLARRVADAYAGIFRAFHKHRDCVKLVTFWGVNDAVSWRANGKPLLFDGNNQPKPAFDAVIAEATRAETAR